ncbi:MAG: putative peptidoglycan glycosyltransferase FtsW [Planctomycetaceae bacterium]
MASVPVPSRSNLLDERAWLFLSLATVLIGFGVLMVHSASITSRPTEFEQIYLKRHILFLGLAVIAASTIAAIPPRYWMQLAPWMFLGTVLLLGATLIPGVGHSANGAQRWLRWELCSLQFQPSELAKLTLPLFLARLAVNRRERLKGILSGTLPFALPAALVIFLVVREPDFSTAAFLTGSAALVLFLAGWPVRNFVVGLGASISGGIYLITERSYRLQRISDLVSVWTDFSNSDAWQLKQSLITLGAGNYWGVGLGRGSQKLSFLPESNTDFVFAVAGEELGMAGTIGLVALWCGLFWTGLQLFRGFRSDCFCRIAGVALLTQLVGQALMNAAVATALIPTTGIPHPLISYGGSSLVVSVMTLGMIISLSRARTGQDRAVLR